MKKSKPICEYCALPLRGTHSDRNWHMETHHGHILAGLREFEISGHLGGYRRRRRVYLANLLKEPVIQKS